MCAYVLKCKKLEHLIEICSAMQLCGVCYILKVESNTSMDLRSYTYRNKI